MKKIFKWLRESNRYAHLVGGILIGFGANDVYCAAYAGLGVASALELKDKMWGGEWSWTDWCMTLSGVIVGRLIGMLVWR